MHIQWGTVDKNGTAVSGGNNVSRIPGANGEYRINLGFSNPANQPAVVGTQTRSDNVTEANTDGIAFSQVSTTSAVAITGNNIGVREDRPFSYMAVGDALDPLPVIQRVLWGAINSDGTPVSSSEGFSVAKTGNPGIYEITFTTGFTSIPAIVATQTNSGSLTEANTDGIVVPKLSNNSATLITGNNRSTPEYRSFSFIAIGEGPRVSQLQPGILWGSINANGTIAGGSGGFWVGRQAQGMYVITFPAFRKPPAIIGSQTGASRLDNRDGMVFPWVNTNYAIAVTGDATGSQQDRSFSFIAFGQPVSNNQE